MSADATALRQIVGNYARDVFSRASESFLDTIEVQAPIKTGELRRSGELTPILNLGTRWLRELRFTAPQALWTDQGTKPHTIRVKNARALVFFWPKAPAELGGPGTYFFLKVNHPGNAASLWFSGNVTDQAWANAVDGAT